MTVVVLSHIGDSRREVLHYTTSGILKVMLSERIFRKLQKAETSTIEPLNLLLESNLIGLYSLPTQFIHGSTTFDVVSRDCDVKINID